VSLGEIHFVNMLIMMSVIIIN